MEFISDTYLMEFGVILGLYFFPSLIAFFRDHHNTGSIVVINLFLGWTVLAWIIALAMACSAVKQTQSS